MNKQINIVIDEYLKCACENIAKKGGISLTQFIEEAMENYLPYFERGLKKKQDLIDKYLPDDKKLDKLYEKDK